MKNQAAEPAGNSDSSQDQQQNVSTSVPPATLAENQPGETHSRSHAAHLQAGNDEPHTKPLTRPGLNPGARKQPNGGHGR